MTPLRRLQKDLVALNLYGRSIRLSVAMNEEFDRGGPRLFEEIVGRADEVCPGGFRLERQLGSPAASFLQRMRRSVLGKVLISAIGSQYVRGAHTANAPMM